jgi:hypothetical protein
VIVNAAPRVYQDNEGNQYATFCRVGTEVAKGRHDRSRPERGCTSMFCACGADESPLTLVTSEEAKGFWEAMDNLAAEAASKW